jgi:hypothetical protein
MIGVSVRETAASSEAPMWASSSSCHIRPVTVLAGRLAGSFHALADVPLTGSLGSP